MTHTTRRAAAGAAALACLGLGLPLAGVAQDVQIHGQVRPRYEFRDPSGGRRDEFTSMRVRLGVAAQVDPSLSVFIQAQDVRLWGEEGNTLGDFRADNVDLHQAYLRYRGRKLDWLTATLGRQETNFGGQRLVGAVGWTQQGRSFDGVRLDIDGGNTDVALIAYTLADATAPAHEADAELYGAYATVGGVGPGSLDVYWLFDRGEGAARTSQSTLGARYAFSSSGVTARLEGTLQRGDRAGADVAAYMVGARLGTKLGERATATAWYDYLSGDDPSDARVGSFSTLYATNHKYYGFADLFLNVPVHTGGHGLQDLALKLAATPREGVRLAADLHRFLAADDTGLSGAHFADELDLTVSHRYTANLGVTAGASFVFQKAPLAEIGRLSENMTWVYVMFDAVF